MRAPNLNRGFPQRRKDRAVAPLSSSQLWSHNPWCAKISYSNSMPCKYTAPPCSCVRTTVQPLHKACCRRDKACSGPHTPCAPTHRPCAPTHRPSAPAHKPCVPPHRLCVRRARRRPSGEINIELLNEQKPKTRLNSPQKAAKNVEILPSFFVFLVFSRGMTFRAIRAIRGLFPLIRFAEGFNRRRGEPTEAPRSRR
jgi:hypothetical protein